VVEHSLTYAKHDPAHCLVPGLFRSLKRGERKKAKLDITYSLNKNESLRFIGFEPLGADDMRILQGIVALGGVHGVLLTQEPETAAGQQLRILLDPKFEAIDQDGMVVKESLSKLLTEIGMVKSGDNIKSLKASLVRMANITVIVTKEHKQASFHLMSYTLNEDDWKIWIALNPRIAEAILGRRPYTRINMAEVRALKTDPSRLIHQRLCGWIDVGKVGRIDISTLCNYVWPNAAPTEAAQRQRKSVARKAIIEIGAIGWTLNEYIKDRWEIRRPS
jgi:plasmid and phage iteron-binding protein